MDTFEKKYNEALERARALWREAIEKEYANDYLKDYETIFPELRESEDEEIYREIYTIVHHSYQDKAKLLINPKRKKEQLGRWEKAKAYLEKQKDITAVSNIQEAYRKGFDYAIEAVKQKPEKYGLQKEQKPAEIDEYKIIKKHITYDVLSSEVNKRLKECGWYVTDEKLAEWSEVDKKMLLSIINAFRNGTVSTIRQEQWLKSLPERFNLQPKQEWSEEDKRTLTHIQSHLKYLTEHRFEIKDYNTMEDRMILESEIEWLKNRFKSLRPSWKPSEEQMEALNAMNCCGELSYQGQQQLLIDLYQQLKKLI